MDRKRIKILHLLLDVTIRSRLIVGVVVTALILLALRRMQWLRGAWLAEAWYHKRELLLWMAGLQLLMVLCNGLRYYTMLRACGVKVKLGKALSATCISTGLSVWLPASASIAEILRIGLIGQHRSRNPYEYWGGVTLASAIDRLLGLFVVFFLAICLIAYALLSKMIPRDSVLLVYGMGVGNLLALGAILLAIRLCIRGRAIAPQRCSASPNAGDSRLGRFKETVRLVLEALRARTVHPGTLIIPAALAALSFLLIGLITGISLHALGGLVPFIWVMAALPLLTLVSVLPISVGGLGGPQVAAVFLFGMMGCQPAVVASAGLLNAIVVLAANSVLGALCLPLFLYSWKAR